MCRVVKKLCMQCHTSPHGLQLANLSRVTILGLKCTSTQLRITRSLLQLRDARHHISHPIPPRPHQHAHRTTTPGVCSFHCNVQTSTSARKDKTKGFPTLQSNNKTSTHSSPTCFHPNHSCIRARRCDRSVCCRCDNLHHAELCAICTCRLGVAHDSVAGENNSGLNRNGT